ncbi:unnamed protein product [Trichogramma brassicae]|uniref:Uncharacterized protein n=1 Tax=Trichogramma brassicae TaxID=86971 RepID=A0A6H5ICD5_9HYME|nr:unnamed protein product [Trichogramma brassicae]
MDVRASRARVYNKRRAMLAKRTEGKFRGCGPARNCCWSKFNLSSDFRKNDQVRNITPRNDFNIKYEFEAVLREPIFDSLIGSVSVTKPHCDRRSTPIHLYAYTCIIYVQEGASGGAAASKKVQQQYLSIRCTRCYIYIYVSSQRPRLCIYVYSYEYLVTVCIRVATVRVYVSACSGHGHLINSAVVRTSG